MTIQVSIIIPSYNRAHILPRAVKSVLAQTYQNFEIIIVDDCSKDNTDEVVKSFADPRIRYIKHEKNKGGNAARNTGVKEARGEFVAFLDSDDEWLPAKLEKQLPLFDDQSVGLVYCGFTFFEEGVGKGALWLVPSGPNYREDILVSNFVGSTSLAVVRKGLLDQIDGFDESLKSCQDWDLYIRLSEVCEFLCAQESLVLYYINRKAKNQITTNPISTISGHMRMEQKYSDKVMQLPAVKQLRYIDNLFWIYSEALGLRGCRLAYRGFLKSGNLKYLGWIFKLLIKKQLRFVRLY